MKGQLNTMLTVFAILLSVSIFFFIYVATSKTIIVNVDILKSSFETLAVVDATHNIDICLFGADSNNLQQKLDECKKQESVSYAQIIDVETGKKYSSGSSEATSTGHAIYKNLQVGNSIHQAKLYVKK